MDSDLYKKRSDFQIVTNTLVRDPRIERQMIELRREQVLYALMLAGAILIFIGVVW